MKRALEKRWLRPLVGLPRDFRQSLLQDPATRNMNRSIVPHKNSREDQHDNDDGDGDGDDSVPSLPLRGIPIRPFYREISKRLCILHHHHQYQNNRCNTNTNINTNHEILYGAEKLQLTELSNTTVSSITIPAPPRRINTLSCALWLRAAQPSGIRRLLGMRSTIGSIVTTTAATTTAFPIPDVDVLIAACREPHKNKPNNGKSPQLSVCARARSKHAHRGAVDQFFGEVRGGVKLQNKVSEEIVCRLLRDAVWMNVHQFGGTVEPVLEVRVQEGYGARWSLGSNTSASSNSKHDPDDGIAGNCVDPVDEVDKKNKDQTVVFRGFLEPQMEDGHALKWRH